MKAQNQHSDDWLDDFGEELEDKLDHHSAKNLKKFRDSGDPAKKSGLRKKNKPARGKKEKEDV